MQRLLLLLLLGIPMVACAQVDPNFFGQEVRFTTTDNLEISADMCLTENEDDPVIVLCHQAGFSRGAYREIAPKLNALGFHCLAIDQRSGKTAQGVENETHKRAKESGMATAYADAVPDIDAAIKYAYEEISNDVILWGSSYSAALTFYLGATHNDDIKAILAFSPGEYMKVKGKNIEEYAALVTCPVFVTSAKNEQKQWQGIYDAVQSEKEFFLPKTKGFHGSKCLWKLSPGHEEYWRAVGKFLKLL